MLESLRKVLKQEDTVLFIGSGVSLWSGLPSWSGMIKELVEFLNAIGENSSLVSQELTRGDLLQAASYGFDRLTRQQIAEFIRKSSRLGHATPHDIHRKILGLGPVCFITTNYDNLLEKSFSKWMPDTHFRTVVNRQLTETAEIVGSRAKRFLFKVHGDAADSDSIVLTREQYRALHAGGELHHALEAVKTLMLSRPIVYIGFGLKDPDFLYLKDLLQNTFKGGARDHYAIMADVGEQEKDYWRRHFGIHIIPYPTIDKGDGQKDHSPILNLLDELRPKSDASLKKSITIDAEFTLNLARHAAKYMEFDTSNSHIPLVVHYVPNRKLKRRPVAYHHYDNFAVEKLLDDEIGSKMLLVGLPGSGKSYALKNSAARFARKLYKQCFDGSIERDETVIPIYADLKLYQGSIIDLLSQSIPAGISLEFLWTTFKIRVYLDAFNEMPREYIASNHWRTDFLAVLDKAADFIVISSRTADGLDDLDFPVFNIDAIDEDFVESKLIEKELSIGGIFKADVIGILQRPFFFNLIFKKSFPLEVDTTPQKIYNDLISLVETRFQQRFSLPFKILPPLANAAVYALENGEEVFKIEILTRYLDQEIQQISGLDLHATDIVNWLVSQDFIIPISDERICFFHQSVTEYLAATTLATAFLSSNDILRDKLAYQRWDQALFLALSLLDEKSAANFLEIASRTDLLFTLSSVRYMEGDTTMIVNQLLERIASSKFGFQAMHEIGSAIVWKLPISTVHVKSLKRIVNLGDTLGGSAAAKLIELLGDDFKGDALKLIVDHCDDYNFCGEVGRSLQGHITADDLPILVALTKEVQIRVNTIGNLEHHGFREALGEVLEELELPAVYSALFDKNIPFAEQNVAADILMEYLNRKGSQEALEICADLLLKGLDRVVVEIYFITAFSKRKDNLDLAIFSIAHIRAITRIIKKRNCDNSDWALGALTNICSKRGDFVPYIVEVSRSHTGILRAALLYSVSYMQGIEAVFEAFEELLTLSRKELVKERASLIGHIDLTWRGREGLFVELIKLRDAEIAYNLCDRVSHFDRLERDPLLLDIGPIDWWLDWYKELSPKRMKHWMFFDRVSRVIVKCVSPEKRKEFVDEFNNPTSQYRDILSEFILPMFDDLALQQLSAESIQYLLDRLKKSKINSWSPNILSEVATETFVESHLLPRLKTAKGLHLQNLKLLIETIGKKHKRRYAFE